MGSMKILCIVFILTLLGGIRANVDSNNPAPTKHVAMHEMMPLSIMYLLHSRPLRPLQPSPSNPQKLPSSDSFNPILPSAPVPPTAPVAPLQPALLMYPSTPFAPTLPNNPASPTSAMAPNGQVLPLPTTQLVAPGTPIASNNPGDHSPKYKPVHQVLPPSLLYLLHQRPMIRPQPSQPIPLRPSTAPPKPYTGYYPLVPSEAASSNSPKSSVLVVPVVSRPKPIVHERNYQTRKPVSTTSFPGQLSYDNPSDGNRKLLNVVHIPLRSAAPKPEMAPVGATSLNNIKPHNVPLGPTPISPQASKVSKPEGLSPVPINAIEALPIPAKLPISKEGSDESKNMFTVHPKDLLVQKINNIEASPIPIKPNNDGNTDTNKAVDNGDREDLSPVPINAIETLPIPAKPPVNKKGSDESKNTFTVRPKDLPVQQIKNIEASPIPIKPNNDGNTDTNKAVDNGVREDLSPVPLNAVETLPIPAKPPVSKKGSDESKNTFTVRPKDLPVQQIKNIEASPIPIKPNNDVNSDTKKAVVIVNPEYLSPKPVNTIGASPIPVKTKSVIGDKSNETSNPNNLLQAQTADAMSTTSDKGGQNKKTQNDSQDSTVTQNQKDIEETKSNTINESDQNNSSDSNTGNVEKKPEKELPSKESNEPNNPLKDLILNDTTSIKHGEDANRTLSKESQLQFTQQESGDGPSESSKDNLSQMASSSIGSSSEQESSSAEESGSSQNSSTAQESDSAQESGSAQDSSSTQKSSTAQSSDSSQDSIASHDSNSSEVDSPQNNEEKSDISALKLGSSSSDKNSIGPSSKSDSAEIKSKQSEGESGDEESSKDNVSFEESKTESPSEE